MARKKYIAGTKLKAPTYSVALRDADKVKREAPAKPPPGRHPREYDLNRPGKGHTKTGGIWELILLPFEGLSILAEELRDRARAELLEEARLEDEILDLRILLESDQITEQEYEKREKEIRAKYDEKAPTPPKLKLGRKRTIRR